MEDAFHSTGLRSRSAALRDVGAITGVFAVGSLIYWAGVWAMCGGPGFPFDDSFIHLQFARNLSVDGQMAFNRGVPSSGSTAPAYPLLLAIVHLMVRNWYAASYLLGAACSLGTALAVYGILRRWTGRAEIGRWGGVLTVLISPTIMQAYNGMEAPVYSLLFLLGLALYGTDRWRLASSGVLALGIWLRPEFLIFLPIICCERCLAWRSGFGGRAGGLIKQLSGHAAIWAAMAACYAAYHWHQDGHLVPTTFTAKQVVHHESKPTWLDNLPAAIRHREPVQVLLAILVWPTILLLLAGVGLGSLCAPVAYGLKDACWALWRDPGERGAGWRLAIMALIGYPWLRGFVDSVGLIWFQQQRYYAHLTPLLVIVVLGALPMTATVMQRPVWSWKGVPWPVQRRRTYAWAGAGTALFTALGILSVWNIDQMQVRMARWVREHTTEDQLIATNDIGALAFLGERRILDTVGLVEPGIIDHYLSGGTLLAYLRERDPAFVVIFPNWYEELSGREDILERMYSVKLGLNVICGGSEFVAYRPRWARGANASPPRMLSNLTNGE